MPGVIQKAAMKFIFQKGKVPPNYVHKSVPDWNTKQEGIQKFAKEEPSHEPSPSSHSYAEWMILADLSLTTSDSMEKEQIKHDWHTTSFPHTPAILWAYYCNLQNL